METHTPIPQVSRTLHGSAHSDAAAAEDNGDPVPDGFFGDLGDFDDDGDDLGTGNAAHAHTSKEPHIHDRVPREFNFSDFLLLANRVIDQGDDESIKALHNLHR
ncbi:UNVERIFIED_CONTAM: hypothetical protein Sindi_1860700 [Sesamum indicum]